MFSSTVFNNPEGIDLHFIGEERSYVQDSLSTTWTIMDDYKLYTKGGTVGWNVLSTRIQKTAVGNIETKVFFYYSLMTLEAIKASIFNCITGWYHIGPYWVPLFLPWRHKDRTIGRSSRFAGGVKLCPEQLQKGRPSMDTSGEVHLKPLWDDGSNDFSADPERTGGKPGTGSEPKGRKGRKPIRPGTTSDGDEDPPDDAGGQQQEVNPDWISVSGPRDRGLDDTLPNTQVGNTGMTLHEDENVKVTGVKWSIDSNGVLWGSGYPQWIQRLSRRARKHLHKDAAGNYLPPTFEEWARIEGPSAVRDNYDWIFAGSATGSSPFTNSSPNSPQRGYGGNDQGYGFSQDGIGAEGAKAPSANTTSTSTKGRQANNNGSQNGNRYSRGPGGISNPR